MFRTLTCFRSKRLTPCGLHGRTFHSFNNILRSQEKLDPSRYRLSHSILNLETIKQFRRTEDRYKEVVDREGLDPYNMESIPDFDTNDPHFHKLIMPTPSTTPEDAPLEGPSNQIEPLDLESDDGFSKAISYLSEEQHERPDTLEDKEELEEPMAEKFPILEVLKVGRHTQITAGGRVYSFSVLVLVGTGRGTAGLGYARGNSVPEALALAKSKAFKNLMSIELWRGNNVGANFRIKYKKTYVFFKARKTGSGRSCGFDMGTLLDAFGIDDCIMGHGGSENPHTLYRAVFQALRDRTRTPEKVARMLGRKLFNRAGAFYYSNE